AGFGYGASPTSVPDPSPVSVQQQQQQVSYSHGHNSHAELMQPALDEPSIHSGHQPVTAARPLARSAMSAKASETHTSSAQVR
ncbi:MAG: hypothetical protein SEPTF4163_006338, partial [Sporothrix epigloea]